MAIGNASTSWWANISRGTLRADLMAGLVGALLVLPQGIAFAHLAGLPAEYGLYTAIVPCVVAALAGSSWHVVSGPTNANSLALFAMLSPLAVAGSDDYIRLVLTATFMVGLLQLAIAWSRLGSIANFISPSVLTGFTAGAACLIGYHALVGLTSQIGGVAGGNFYEAGVALATVATTVIVRKLRPGWPAMLLGLLAGYLLARVWTAQHGPDAVRLLGPMASTLPPLSLPDLSPNTLGELSGIALALTIVALGQSISIAKAVAERSGQMIDTNREFFGQGLSNVVGSFFSSYLSCGSLNRSMPNYDSGARSPLAAVFSSLILLALIGAGTSALSDIPMAAINALLLYVAWTLINLPKVLEIMRFGRQEASCLLVTWASTLLISVEFAILLGVGLSLIFYLYQTSRPVMRVLVPAGRDRHFTPVEDLHEDTAECPQLKLVRMEGDVFFGATQYVEDVLHQYRERHPEQKHLLVMAKSMNFVDLAGERLWSRELRARRAIGGDLYFHRPRARVIDAWRKSGLYDELAGSHIFRTKCDAITAIFETLDPAICRGCKARIFLECPTAPSPPDETANPSTEGSFRTPRDDSR